MKNAIEFAKKFKTFRRKLPTIETVANDQGVIGELIYSHLLWNATSDQATTAYKKLIDATVDLNDLRINHVIETVELIGVHYPQAQERSKRLRSVLNAIYIREYCVAVPSLTGAGKREIREYFETLNGMTLFVCNRVISLCYEVAAVPVDERTLAALISNGLIHESMDMSETASWLARQVKATEVIDMHAGLHDWACAQVIRSTSKTKKKSTKKKTAEFFSITKPKPEKKKPVKKAVVKKKTTKKKVTKKKKKK